MEDKPSLVRTDRYPFEARDFEKGKTFEASITKTRMSKVARRGKGAVHEVNSCVREVLLRPQSMHQGIRWDKDEDLDANGVDSWLCFCGKPKHYFAPNDERPRLATEGQVFLVFMNKDRVVYNWFWDKESDVLADCPIGCPDRFHRRVL